MTCRSSAAIVPRHYTVNVTATPDSMLRLIQSLDVFVREFDAPTEVEDLLAVMREAWVGDLPTAPDVALPHPGDEPPAATA